MNISKFFVVMLLMFLLAMTYSCGTNSGASDESQNIGGNNTETSDSSGGDNHDSDENDSSQNDNNGSSGGNTGGSIPVASGNYTILAWNDLGMHCMDADYSVFSILPPYNVLLAQVIKKGKEPDKLKDTDGITVVYESAVDPDTGSINTFGYGKNNFWQYSKPLYGADLFPDVGLAGKMTPSTTPETLDYMSDWSWFKAEGIPLIPIDDNYNKNFYPLVKVTAKDTNGAVLAETYTVLPVSDEMTCIQCHGSNSVSQDAKPANGWENIADAEKDYRFNILKLHDDKHNISGYLNGLATKGYVYQTSLYQTAKSGTPILCSACHISNALPGSGVTGIKPLTMAVHSKHSSVKDPSTKLALDDVSNRNTCYKCHPGQETQCLRGAMGSASIQCQDCHGGMQNVGSATRNGWFDQPNCQACHYNGKRETTALSNGQIRVVSDNTFATNSNVPATGYSLYRFSEGHKGVKCEACHGSTHAVYPSSHNGDNIQSIAHQGYAGTITECSVCHGDSVPLTENEGPHGMHTIGEAWVSAHEDYAEKNLSSCAYCHGNDYRGSFLSEVKVDKAIYTKKYGTKNFTKGHQISCYDCHNGPKDD